MFQNGRQVICVLLYSISFFAKTEESSLDTLAVKKWFSPSNFDFLGMLYYTIAPPPGTVNIPYYCEILRQLYYTKLVEKDYAINRSSIMIISVPIHLWQLFNLWMMSFLKLWNIRFTALTLLQRICGCFRQTWNSYISRFFSWGNRIKFPKRYPVRRLWPHLNLFCDQKLHHIESMMV